jgi:hypothetical protein
MDVSTPQARARARDMHVREAKVRPVKTALRLARANADLARGIDVELNRARVEDWRDGLQLADACQACGRPLEDPVSKARKIGPTCWAKGKRPDRDVIPLDRPLDELPQS